MATPLGFHSTVYVHNAVVVLAERNSKQLGQNFEQLLQAIVRLFPAAKHDTVSSKRKHLKY
jgi:hypothetical protein